MNIIVSGGPDFNDWEVFKRSLDRIRFPYCDSFHFLCCDEGECDSLLKRYAHDKGVVSWSFPASLFIPRNDSFRIRNMDIVQQCDGAVLFWDQKCDVVGHLIHVLEIAHRRTVVFDYYGNIILNLEY
mgnify:CR=1 FL=1